MAEPMRKTKHNKLINQPLHVWGAPSSPYVLKDIGGDGYRLGKVSLAGVIVFFIPRSGERAAKGVSLQPEERVKGKGSYLSVKPLRETPVILERVRDYDG